MWLPQQAPAAIASDNVLATLWRLLEGVNLWSRLEPEESATRLLGLDAYGRARDENR